MIFNKESREISLEKRKRKFTILFNYRSFENSNDFTDSRVKRGKYMVHPGEAYKRCFEVCRMWFMSRIFTKQPLDIYYFKTNGESFILNKIIK